LISNFFESIGTEMEPSLVNSYNNFISRSSKRCNLVEMPGYDLIYVDKEWTDY
jgi:hypothetical protein